MTFIVCCDFCQHALCSDPGRKPDIIVEAVLSFLPGEGRTTLYQQVGDFNEVVEEEPK